MRRRLSTILTLGLVAVVTLLPGATSAQDADLATPEDAVSAYVAGIAGGDVEAILAASAIDEVAAGFDFQAFSERLRAMSLVTSLAPAEYPLFQGVNRYQQANWVLGQVRNLVYGLLSGEEIDGKVIAPVDAERIAAFVAAVDPTRLAGMTVLDVRGPDPELATDERYLENIARQAAVYGADELAERLALVELGGSTYGLGFTLLRYGDTWKVWNQASVLLGTSVFGTAEPMTREEFVASTGG